MAVFVCGMQVALLEAGKHVLVEKPVTPDFPQLLSAQDRHPRKPALVVGFQRRFDPEYRRYPRGRERGVERLNDTGML